MSEYHQPITITATPAEKEAILKNTTPRQRTEVLLEFVGAARTGLQEVGERLVCRICGIHSQKGALRHLAREGWDWFTGFLPYRVEICPRCCLQQKAKRDELFALSRTKQV